ncbi:hypothetical protein MKW94_016077, partial [Papaver nudicaule]|nr:hypothetical protein [Papaver nudicaule]
RKNLKPNKVTQDMDTDRVSSFVSLFLNKLKSLMVIPFENPCLVCFRKHRQYQVSIVLAGGKQKCIICRNLAQHNLLRRRINNSQSKIDFFLLY